MPVKTNSTLVPNKHRRHKESKFWRVIDFLRTFYFTR